MTRDTINTIFAGVLDDLLVRVTEAGVSLGGSAEEVRVYAAERLVHIEALAADPSVGLGTILEAAEVEAGNIELFAALRAVKAGDEVDIAARAALLSGIRTAFITTAQVLAAL